MEQRDLGLGKTGQRSVHNGPGAYTISILFRETAAHRGVAFLLCIDTKYAFQCALSKLISGRQSQPVAGRFDLKLQSTCAGL